MVKLRSENFSGIQIINGLLISSGCLKARVICWKIGNKIINDRPVMITALKNELALSDILRARTAL